MPAIRAAVRTPNLSITHGSRLVAQAELCPNETGIDMHTTSDRRTAAVLGFHVRLAGALSRKTHQRFFGRMQAAMSRQGLLMNWSGGVVLAVGRHTSAWREDRHRIVIWLIDQPEVREIFLFQPMSLNKMLGDDLYLEFEAARLQQSVEEITSWVLGRTLMGLISRAIMELQFNGEAVHGSRR